MKNISGTHTLRCQPRASEYFVEHRSVSTNVSRVQSPPGIIAPLVASSYLSPSASSPSSYLPSSLAHLRGIGTTVWNLKGFAAFPSIFVRVNAGKVCVGSMCGVEAKAGRRNYTAMLLPLLLSSQVVAGDALLLCRNVWVHSINETITCRSIHFVPICP